MYVPLVEWEPVVWRSRMLRNASGLEWRKVYRLQRYSHDAALASAALEGQGEGRAGSASGSSSARQSSQATPSQRSPPTPSPASHHQQPPERDTSSVSAAGDIASECGGEGDIEGRSVDVGRGVWRARGRERVPSARVLVPGTTFGRGVKILLPPPPPERDTPPPRVRLSEGGSWRDNTQEVGASMAPVAGGSKARVGSDAELVTLLVPAWYRL
jgi:hypothetical protein